MNPNTDSAFWMPFTANRDFERAPRRVASASRHHYQTTDGRSVYDMFSGLWTSGLGHCHPAITEAIAHQAGVLDFNMSFQFGNELAPRLADRLTALAPDHLEHCFFTNSGSESVDTALKIALAYHRACGQPERTMLIGRQRGYHGVNFGGMSVGGIPNNQKAFSGNLLPRVDHLPHTFNLAHNAFSKGQPGWGAHLADELSLLIDRHGAESIAAVIVEPVAGSTGILPPPVGYLEKLRQICTDHGILLIFDEVITAFGRIGEPFAAQRFGVAPDLITLAKGLTNGTVPMGAVLASDNIYQAFMTGPTETIELFHGYTYSGHPLAAAAGLATLDVYESELSFASARNLEPQFEKAVHSLADHPLVIDVRNFGLMAGVDLAPDPDAPGRRGLEAHKRCFHEENLVIRNAMDTLQFAPFLNAEISDVERGIESVRRVLDHIDR
ncbi:MAG: aminotransferase class III-fold pyridoxal phosphate-dependent enzyme [Pseudomonadota bacterium]